MCQTSHNIPGGWAFVPCPCNICQADRDYYKRVTLPKRLALIERMEALACETNRL